MKQTAKRVTAGILSVFLLTTPALAAETLIPVGEVIGLELRDGRVTVAAFDDTLTCARDAGIQIGDEIIAIDATQIDTAEDVRQALDHSDGTVDITLARNGQEQQIHLAPDITADGPKLGVYLRQGITGIGTITWYDPDTGAFGTLGHAVTDGKGQILPMGSGIVYPATVVSVQKGKSGTPGQLRGSVNNSHLLGQLTGNTAQGVFGSARSAWSGQAMPLAEYEEIKTGPATIRSTIDAGTPRDYSVEILKIYPKARADSRNFLIKVTDPALLEATGGIVQGMGVSYNRDNTGTLRSLQGLGDSPGFSLTKRNPCTRAGTQGRTSFVSSDQAIRMKYIERRFDNLSTLIKQPNIILPHRIRHRAVSVTLFGVFLFDAITDWRKI